MNTQGAHPTGILQILIPIVVVAVIFAFRMRGMSRPRPLKIAQLWIVPVMYAIICAVVIGAHPPTALGWLAVVVGLAIGAAIGWWRGKTTHIEVDAETQELRQRASPLGMLVLMGVILAKVTLGAEGRNAHLEWLGNGLLGVALGMMLAMRVEMYLRARRVVASAQARVFS